MATPPAAHPDPEVSCIVCTHNGSGTLGLAMAAITSQTLDRPYEVIVVDDASSDESGRIASEAGAIVVRRDESSGLAAARNAGLAVARGEVVVFTDDDCEPAPGWLAHLIAPLEDPAVDGVTGLTTVASTSTLEFRYLELRNPLRPLPEVILRTKTPFRRLLQYLSTEVGPTPRLEANARVYNLVGANMALRRGTIEAVGGFDESFFTSSEEEELCVRIHAHLGGAEFRYEPAARVAHHYRPGFRDSLRRARHYGHGNIMFARHRGVMPIVYPFPVAIGLLSMGAVARRTPIWFAAVLAAPAVLYGRWLAAFPRRRSETLVYPYLQFLQELAFTWGEIRAMLGFSR
jgi:O-antigen biosynthesis protein